jgi:SAM-dependent methyltransferase
MQSVNESIRSAGIASIPWIPPASAVRSPSIGLRCPVCKDFLIALSYRSLARGNSGTYCAGCGTPFEQDHGIWQGLHEARAAHYARFIETAERHGLEAGNANDGLDNYLAPPFRDLASTSTRLWSLRAKTFRFLRNEILSKTAAERNTPLTILDLGAGNGWMSYRLARMGHRPVAVDLLTNSTNGLGAAVNFRRELPELFPRFQAEFDNLPFADGQFDCAIFNASFHYSEHFDRTIAEAVRCLRPGGVLAIADSPTYSVEARMFGRLKGSKVCDLEQVVSDTRGVANCGYLTPQRLIALEVRHELEWSSHRCWYGIRWACREWLSRWRKNVEFPEFILYSAQVKTR